MRDITYCSQTLCAHLDCARHQYHAPLDSNLSIADLNDGLCFTPMEFLPNDSELPGNDSREALVCKALDRYNNLSDAPLSLSADAVGKNVAETELLLMPVLKEAKAIYPDLADALFIMRTNLDVLLNILKKNYENEYLKWKAAYMRTTYTPTTIA